MSSTPPAPSHPPHPPHPPTEPPKPVNPEPQHEDLDPEKGRVKEPPPGKSDHPTQ
jgi:hypothetical protein